MTSSSESKWIICPRPEPQAPLRLFCLPHAGGGASAYVPWAQQMPADIEVCAVQLPGRETRLDETAFTRMLKLIDALEAGLLPYLDRPFALFGHSMGALTGYELSRRLQARGVQPVRLFVSAHRAPHLPDRDNPVHALPEPEFLDELRRLNGTPEDVFRDDELREMVVPALRADFELCETYDHRAADPLDCPITALGGLADENVSREELDAWAAHTRADFAVRMFPGDHFYLHQARSFLLPILARELLGL